MARLKTGMKVLHNAIHSDTEEDEALAISIADRDSAAVQNGKPGSCAGVNKPETAAQRRIESLEGYGNNRTTSGIKACDCGRLSTRRSAR